MDADIEKKQEPAPNVGLPGEGYGEIVASQGQMGFFGRIIDGFRENPKCVPRQTVLRGKRLILDFT